MRTRVRNLAGLTACAVVCAGWLVLSQTTNAEEEVRKAADKAAKAKSVRMVYTVEKDGKSKVVATAYVLDGGRKTRIEGYGDTTEDRISDFAAGKVLQIDRVSRLAALSDTQGQKALKAHELEEIFDPVKWLKRDGGEVREIQGEALGNRKTRVFQGGVKGQATGLRIWIDAETGLPARLSGNTPDEGVFIGTWDKWNEEFDAKLFALTPPQGYNVIEGPQAVELMDILRRSRNHDSFLMKSSVSKDGKISSSGRNLGRSLPPSISGHNRTAHKGREGLERGVERDPRTRPNEQASRRHQSRRETG